MANKIANTVVSLLVCAQIICMGLHLIYACFPLMLRIWG